jgi:hypothetical protein
MMTQRCMVPWISEFEVDLVSWDACIACDVVGGPPAPV